MASRESFCPQGGGALLATILATPYSLDYDLMVLAPAIAFLPSTVARGFGPRKKTALAFLWIVPLIARSFAQVTLIPLGVIAMLMIFAIVLRRARSDFPSRPRPAPAADSVHRTDGIR